jgi:hypothetical protein
MIQFNRYQLPDETPDLHADVVKLVGLMSEGLRTAPEAGVPLLFEMAYKYPGNLRIAAIAARLHFWGVLGWDEIKDMIPQEIPRHYWYAQEIGGCLGYEQTCRQWQVTEDEWYLLQGYSDDVISPWAHAAHGYVMYRPPSAGFFSVIENIVAACMLADRDGYALKVDLSGNWWAYDEPFEELFENTFEFCNGGLPMLRFESMRKHYFDIGIYDARILMNMKLGWYNQIYLEIVGSVGTGSVEDDCGTMFLRGGDKLQTETILPPTHILLKELTWMKRHCRQRVILSDDPMLGQMIKARDPDVLDRSNQLPGGYHHLPQRKQSCIPLLQNYLAMVEAKHNFSCPSANLANAAQWSRNDDDNYSSSNPVGRYLLI